MVSCPGKCIPIKKFCRQAKAEIQEAIQKVRQYHWKYKSANKKLEEMKLNMKSKEKWKKLTKNVKSLKTTTINTLKVTLAGQISLLSKRSILMVSLFIWLGVHIVKNSLPNTSKSLNIFVYNCLQTLGSRSFYKLQRVR